MLRNFVARLTSLFGSSEGEHGPTTDDVTPPEPQGQEDQDREIENVRDEVGPTQPTIRRTNFHDLIPTAEGASGRGIDESVLETFAGTGEVTLYEALLPRGVINGIYFFNKAAAPPGVKLGSSVEFRAQKSPECVNWDVTFMKLLMTEEELKKVELQRFRTVVGRVEKLEANGIVLRYGNWNLDRPQILQIPQAMLPTDYKVIISDYLRVKVEIDKSNWTEGVLQREDGDLTGKITSVEPTIKKKIIGTVVSRNMQQSIDHRVYFDYNVCAPGFRPKIRDTVRATCVESNQRPYMWRAIFVDRSEFGSYASNPFSNPTNNDCSDGWLDDDTVWSDHLAELLKDKHDVQIQPRKEVQFGNVRIGSCVSKVLRVENRSFKPIVLRGGSIERDQSICQFELGIEKLQIEFEGAFIKILPKSVFDCEITCRPQMLGGTQSLCILDFDSFKIGRELTVNCISNEANLMNQISTADSNVGNRRDWQENRSERAVQSLIDMKGRENLRGPSLIRPAFFVPSKMDNNPAPSELLRIVKNMDEPALLRLFPALQQPLKIQTYTDKFQATLWLEEVENEIIRSRNNLDNVIMRKIGDDLMAFDVPGLKEFYPPILTGDRVSVWDRYNPNSPRVEGYIREVRAGIKIIVKINQEFRQKYDGSYVAISFIGGRNTFRRNHHGITQVVRYLGQDWLFPKENAKVKPPRIHFIEEEMESADECDDDDEGGETQPLTSRAPLTSVGANNSALVSESKDEVSKLASPKLERRMKSIRKFQSTTKGPSSEAQRGKLKLEWFNQRLNSEQKDAVRRILRGQCRPLPYIIFGPPGTGKTVTVVEAIMQIYTLDSNSRSLVVAPSNSAADVIAQQLVATGKFRPGDFVRLVGFMRLECQIPEDIREYSYDGENLDVVARNRLIICTCSTAGQFFNLGLDTGHFTHVFVDEAGYCTEPEAVMPVVLVALDKAGQVILAGDPKQLGPVLMSEVAEKCGLGTSLLERLMGSPLYSRNLEKFPQEKYNPVFLTKLVKNYRAHPTLLKVPSKLFYDDELESAAPESEINLCHSLEFLDGRGVPVLFHGLQGKADREKDSPSWYNGSEVVQVLMYVRKLRNHGLSNDDIGIITPYRKQVEKIRKSLQLGLLQDEVPKVGSVEEFQGGERKVMIMSLVRSETANYLNDPKKKEKVVEMMSFIYSSKRFNVAITRAKALLIVIGNPHVLKFDENWLVFLKYCIELGAYVGCELPIELDPKSSEFLASAPPRRSADDSKEEEGFTGT